MPTPTAMTTTVASIRSGSKRARRRIAGRGISTTIRRPNRVFKRRRSRTYWFRAGPFAFIGIDLNPCAHSTAWLPPECRLARGPLVDSAWDQVLDIAHARDQLIHGLLRDSGPNRSAERVSLHTKKAH